MLQYVCIKEPAMEYCRLVRALPPPVITVATSIVIPPVLVNTTSSVAMDIVAAVKTVTLPPFVVVSLLLSLMQRSLTNYFFHSYQYYRFQ